MPSLAVLHRTTDAFEAETLCSRLRAAGIDVVLHGASQASLFGGAQLLIEQQLLVPADQLELSRAVLEAQPLLDGTAPSGESLADAVCPVHEQPAVATCVRCGTFLCAGCGSLGTPPVCESCVARPEETPRRSGLMLNVARLWAGVWVASLVAGLLISLSALLRYLLR